MNECVVAFLMMLLFGSGQTFLTHRSTRELDINKVKFQNYSKPVSEPLITPANPIEKDTDVYICIEVPPNLPPCNFDRLPFRLPFCNSEESKNPSARVENLRPFKTKDELEIPKIFPNFNYTEWLKEMKILEDEIKFSFESKQRRETELLKPIKRKSKISEKYNSNRIYQGSYKKKNILNMKKTIHKTQKRIEKDIQKAKGLDQELNKLADELESPYFRASDSKKLQVAQKGSEFPYSEAIPYNAEKLKVARERSIYPMWKDTFHRPKNDEFPSNFQDFEYDNEISYKDHFLNEKRNYNSRKLQSIGKNSDVPFNYLNSRKENEIVSYSKRISRDDTSRSIEKNSQLNDNREREMKTRIHLGESNYHYRPLRLAESTKSLKYPFQTLKKDNKLHNWKISHNVKTFGSESEFLNETPHLSRKLKFIREGSEFPYPKAIPFDLAKLVAAKKNSELSKKHLDHNAGNIL